jgi:hypothetical protein
MSFPEDIFYEMKAYKPKIDIKLLGALVYAVNDEKKRTWTITGFLPIGSYEDHSADVVCTRISSQGKPKSEDFKMKEIKIIEK